MSWTRWFRGEQSLTRQKRPTSPKTALPRRHRAALLLETLEARVVPSVVAASATNPTMLSDTAAGNVQQPPSVSQNGQYVVYTDTAANLSPGQVMNSKTSSDVFLYNRATGVTTLVSHASNSSVMTADGTSKNAAISANGDWVAYVSNSDNLVNGETLPTDNYTLTITSYNGGTFTFSYNGQTTSGIPVNSSPTVVQNAIDGLGVTATVTNAASNGQYNGVPYNISVTGATDALTFTSNLTGGNLSATAVFDGTHNMFLANQYWVFLYDVQTGTTSIVSHIAGSSTTLSDGTSGILTGYGNSETSLASQTTSVSISGDGSLVTYLSTGLNLVSGQTVGLGYYYQLTTQPASVFVYDNTSDTNYLVSSHYYASTGANSPITVGDDTCYVAVISQDGSTIAFTSDDADVVAGQTYNSNSTYFGSGPSEYEQYFMAQRSGSTWANETTALISHENGNSANAIESASNTTDLDYPAPAITPNGDYIAYVSNNAIVSSPLDSLDNTGYGDNIYLYNATAPNSITNNNTLVSHIPGNLIGSSNASNNMTSTMAPAPVISDNGQYVAFLSNATNLTTGGTSPGYNLYLFNALATDPTNNVTLISHTSIPTDSVSGIATTYPPITPSISGNGQYIAYIDYATAADVANLNNINNSTSGLAGADGLDVLVYDQGPNPGTSTPTYTLVSHAFASATTTSTASAYTPVISEDGSTITFLEDGNNLLPTTVGGHTGQDLNAALPTDGTDLYAYNLTTPTGYTTVAGNGDTASAPLGSNSTVTLRDPNLPSDTGNGMSEVSPVGAVSGNGNYTVFFSNAPNLVPGEIDTTLTLNVYLYNRSDSTTTLISKAAGTTATVGNGESTNAVISGDGSTVLFYSYATNLLAGETWAGTAGQDVELYMYNVNTGTLSLVSHTLGNNLQAANGTLPGSPNGVSGYSTLLYSNSTTAQGLALPSVSDNGQEIAYLSNATDLTGSGGSTALSGTITAVSDPFLGTVTITTASTPGLTTGMTVTIANAGGMPDIDGPQTITVISSTSTSTQFTLSSAIGLGETYTGGGTWTEGAASTTNALLYNRTQNTNTVVSQNGTTAANGNADAVAISGDGSTVAFYDNATNLLASSITTTYDQLYVWSAGQIKLASHAASSTTTAASIPSSAAGSPVWGPLPPSLSSTGAFVAYYFGGNNLVTGQSGTASANNVFLYNVSANSNTLVTHANASATTAGDNPTNANLYEASGPEISADGNYIAYANNSTNLLATALTGQNGQDNVYLYNVNAAQNTLVSHASGSATTPDADGGTSASIGTTTVNSAEEVFVSFIDLALAGNLSSTTMTYGFSASAYVRLYDSDASATTQPVVVGGVYDPTLNELVAATLAPTVLSSDGSTVSWDGLYAENVPYDLNTNLDVFTTVPSSTTTGPTNITLSNTTINATQPLNTTVGILTTTDSNTNQTFTYTLTGANANLFTITGNTLSTNTIFSVGTVTTVPVTIQVTDNPAGQSYTKTFNITVNPVAPTNITLSNATVTTYQATSTTIGTLTTTDANPNQTFTYTILPGTNSNLFTITGNTLQTATVFQATTQTTYTISIQTTDTLGLTYTQQFTITVTPTTAPPTNITLSNNTVNTFQVTNTIIGTLTTTDPNVNQAFTYTIVPGLNGNLFTITGNSLETNTVFTTATTEQVEVQTTDTAGLSFDKTFTITVTATTSGPTNIALSNATVATYQPTGTTIGTLSTTDPNPNQTFTYTIVSGLNGNLFTITGDTLETNTVFTTATTEQVEVQTTDTAGLSYDKTFTITVTPTTASPTNIALSNATVATYQATGTTVGALSTTDPNVNQAFTYTIVSGLNGNLFTITGDTLETNTVFTTATTEQVEVQTTDTAGLSFDKTFTITVTPTTAGPTNISLSNATVATYQATGATIGTLSTTDPNVNQAFTYTIVSGLNGNLFTITGDTLETNSVFTTATTEQVEVQTIDTAGLSYDKTFTITVTPTTAGPTNISLSNATVATYQATGATIGTLSTTDPNVNQAFTYTIVSGLNGNLFTITGDTLETNTVFTTATTEQVEVQTTDTAGLSFDKTFTITVTPTTAGPTNIALSNASTTAYQAAGATVGTLTTTDPNVNQAFTYTIVSGPNSSLFTIAGNTLETNAVIPVTTTTSYNLTVQTTDTAGLSLTRQFTITVNPTTAAPNGITLTGTTVSSGLPGGTVVGTLTTTDPNADQAFTYTIVPGLNGNLFTISGNTLQTNTVFSVTAPTTYQVTVQTTDTAGLSFNETFSVTINPSGPTNIGLSNTVIAAYQPVDTTVGTLSTTDTNSGQSFTYTLVGSNSSLFAVQGSTLVTNAILADNTQTTYDIHVQTTDTLGGTLTQLFAITVNPTTAAPTAITLSGVTVAAYQPIGTTIGTLSTTDPNAGQAFTYTIVSGLNGNLFTISGDTLETNTVFPTATTENVEVQTMDSAGLTITKTFTITVNPSGPTNIGLSNATVASYQPVGTTIGTLSTTDPNPGQAFSYTVETNGNLFAVQGSTLVTAAVLQITTPTTYNVQVQTEDSPLGLTYTKTFSITVNPSTAQPTNIALNSTVPFFSTATAGTLVNTFNTTDPNLDQNFTYSLVSGAGDANNSSFTIDSNTGALETAGPVVVDAPTTYSIEVQVADILGLTYQKALTFTVLPNAALTPPTQVYVNQAWAGLALGTDPDGSGPVIAIGYDSYTTIQPGINAVAPGGTVHVYGGIYQENLVIGKSLTLEGSGSSSTFLVGIEGGTGLHLGGPTINLVGLTLEGFNTGLTAGANTTSVNGNVTNTLNMTDIQLIDNGTGAEFDGLNQVTYTAGSSDAVFSVNSTQFGKGGNLLDYSNVASLTLNGGVGGDVFYVDLAGLGSGVHISDSGTTGSNQAIFDTGPGNNVIAINDTLGGNMVTMGSNAVALSGLVNVVVDGGAGNNTFRVSPSFTGTTYEINGGSGTNTLVEDLSSFYGTGVTYVTNNAISNTASGSVVYYQATGSFGGGVNVNTGNANQIVLVESTLAGATTTINGGSGTNNFYISSTSNLAKGVLSGLAGPLVLNGGTGTNSLVVSDAGDSANNMVYLTNKAINATSLPHNLYYLMNGGRFSSISLSLGSGTDTVNVLSQPTGIPVTIHGGGGNDTFNVSASPASGYNNLLLDGGTGLSTLNVFDESGQGEVQNLASSSSAGQVRVTYSGGVQSQVGYENMTIVKPASINGIGNSNSTGANFVIAVYNKALDRNPTQAELNAWQPILQSPGGEQALVTKVMQSQESEKVVIKGWFDTYLGGDPSAADYTYWLGQLSKGTDVALAELLASSTYYARAGSLNPGLGSDQAFVQQMYQDLLGSVPSGAVQSALSLLPKLGRQGVAEMVLTSGVFEQAMAAADYLDILGRNGTSSELSSWETSTDAQFTMEEQFLLSPEFIQDATTGKIQSNSSTGA